MPRQDSGELFARLITLRNEAGATLYERLKLADQLLSDHDWVHAAEGGGGDESTALDRLEALCFADICGALSLPAMLEVLHAVPQVSVWKQNKFNLRKMHQEMKARQQAQRATTSQTRTVPKAEVGRSSGPGVASPPQGEVFGKEPEPNLAEEVKALRQELRQREEEVRQLRKDNKRLRTALRKVKEMLGTLQTV